MAKRVISVSLGSSKRNHRVETNIGGVDFEIERIGTDGDRDKAIALIKELDGKVDAFGMGGIDLYIYAGTKRYTLRQALPMRRAAVKSPMVDGSGLKHTLERRVIHWLNDNNIIDFKNKKVLVTSAVDRFGLAQTVSEVCDNVVYGDLAFILGWPFRIRKMSTVEILAAVLVPIAVYLPFEMLYPTGDKQEKRNPKHQSFYNEADVITGDFHFIKRFMPKNLQGKIIITNTVTADDVELLRQRGVEMLVTTTPVLEGRSFGTNVMEGVVASLSDKKVGTLTPADYDAVLDRIGLEPRVEYLQKTEEE